MWKKHLFKIIFFFCFLSFCVVCFLIYNYMHEKEQGIQSARNDAQQKTLQATQKIDNELNGLSATVHAIANDISSGRLKREDILNRLTNTLETTPNLFGVGVAFIPYVNNPQVRQLSPYYVNREGGWQPEQELLQVFTVPITYFDTNKQSEIVTGVVFIDYLLDNTKKLMASLELGRDGYGFILDEKGVFIAHPIDDYVKNQTIFNLAESYHDNALRRLAEKAINGESGAIDYIDRATGQAAWIFYQFIPSTHWSMGMVFFKDILETASLQRQLIWICIASVTFLILLLALLFRADKGTTSSLWNFVAFATLLLAGGIGFLWYITQTAPLKELGSTIIVDQVGLQQFLNSYTEQSSTSLFHVPTGIFIESIDFLENGNVSFSGYIWQKYTTGVHESLSRGFILPEAKSIVIKESYHIKDTHVETIGWHFQAVIAHQFDYAKYPFDRRELNLRIMHKDFDKNVILIPDLEAYGVTSPAAKPGIKQELVLSGWLTLKTFFNYHSHNEDTNLGISNYGGHNNFSHLHFTILLKREFLAPFVSNVVPLFIASTILFALQMWLGKTTTFIRTLTGMFFGILLAHIRLRGMVTTPEIVYLEIFYLVVYCSFLLSTISFFLYRYKVKIGYYRDGLIPKLTFWPIIFVSMFIVTTVVFYV